MAANNLVHIALLFSAAGFLVRDELYLRLLVLCGTSFYIAYYYFYPSSPMWDAIYASSLLFTINLALIVAIIRERTPFGISGLEKELLDRFETLNPGQFRKMISCGKWIRVEEKTQLTREGIKPDCLYYLHDGALELSKQGHSFKLGSGHFIGELGFLHNQAASADVFATPGSLIFCWDTAKLWRRMQRSGQFKNAVLALFNLDISRKLKMSTIPELATALPRES